MFIEKNKKIAVVLSSLVLFIGILVVVGWFLDIGWLKNLHPSFVTMKINTAISFIAGAIALLAVCFSKKHIGTTLGVFVFLVGLVTLMQYVLVIDLGIDQLIIKDLNLIQTSDPGRMSPATALNFVFLGLVFVLLGLQKYKSAVNLTLIPLLISFVSFTGYAFGAQSLYKIDVFTSIALHTSILFILLCLNIFILYPRVSFVSIFTENRLGGRFVRIFLPIIIAAPFIFGWIILLGEKFVFYDSIFSFSLFAVSIIVFMSASLLICGYKINQLDSQRYELSLRLSEKTKELRVLSENINSSEHLRNIEEIVRLQDQVVMLERQLKDLYSRTSS